MEITPFVVLKTYKFKYNETFFKVEIVGTSFVLGLTGFGKEFYSCFK